MQNNSPLWLQLVSIFAMNIHIHTNIPQVSFIHYVLFLVIQSLCTPLCLTAAGWRRYNLWLAGKSTQQILDHGRPLFFKTFPGKQHEFSEMCCISFSDPLTLTEEEEVQHWTTCCTGPEAGNVGKKKVQTFVINQQKCRRTVTPGGKWARATTNWRPLTESGGLISVLYLFWCSLCIKINASASSISLLFHSWAAAGWTANTNRRHFSLLSLLLSFQLTFSH